MKELKPVKTKHTNFVYPDQTGEPFLPVTKSKDHVASVWNITFIERLKLIFTGKITMVTKGKNHPLSALYVGEVVDV